METRCDPFLPLLTWDSVPVMADSHALLAAQSYVAFTTFRRNGEAKTSPVWIADLGDGTLGFTTQEFSWKVKRLHNDPRCRLQPSDRSGNPTPGSAVVDATAAVVSGAEFEKVRAKIIAKYGWQFRLITVIGAARKLFGAQDTESNAGVVITLSD